MRTRWGAVPWAILKLEESRRIRSNDPPEHQKSSVYIWKESTRHTNYRELEDNTPHWKVSLPTEGACPKGKILRKTDPKEDVIPQATFNRKHIPYRAEPSISQNLRHGMFPLPKVPLDRD